MALTMHFISEKFTGFKPIRSRVKRQYNIEFEFRYSYLHITFIIFTQQNRLPAAVYRSYNTVCHASYYTGWHTARVFQF